MGQKTSKNRTKPVWNRFGHIKIASKTGLEPVLFGFQTFFVPFSFRFQTQIFVRNLNDLTTKPFSERRNPNKFGFRTLTVPGWIRLKRSFDFSSRRPIDLGPSNREANGCSQPEQERQQGIDYSSVFRHSLYVLKLITIHTKYRKKS